MLADIGAEALVSQNFLNPVKPGYPISLLCRGIMDRPKLPHFVVYRVGV
jgi:hypothetical protein